MLEKLYDALRSGNIPEDKARAAAVEGAQYENRASKIESDLTLLKWMVGVNMLLSMGIGGLLLRLMTSVAELVTKVGLIKVG
jgi:hypothetical protein